MALLGGWGEEVEEEVGANKGILGNFSVILLKQVKTTTKHAETA